MIMTLHPRAQAQVGSGLGLKRPERRRRRWRLSFCRWINEESCPLGMRRAISQPPSKPMHPRDREFVSMESFFRSTPAVWGRGGAGSSVATKPSHPERGHNPKRDLLVMGMIARASGKADPLRAFGMTAGSRRGVDAGVRHRCVDHASLLRARIARCFSRAQSRSRAASRLSCACLPFASAISSFTLLPFQYSAVGTRV